MKKGLLLSIVASTVLFAGGDIAPVEPVAEAPAASCNDFYGFAATGVEAKFHTNEDTNKTKTTIEYGGAALLGVSKEIFSGVILTAEVQGGSTEVYSKVGDENGTRAPGFHEVGSLNQLNVAYSFGNTAIKVGRFTIDGATKQLSPLINTGTTFFGLKKTAFEGAIVANTDIADTTVWGAYIYNTVNLLDKSGIHTGRARAGVIAGGFQNKSFADTTITVAGYYDLNGTGKNAWTYMVAASVDHSFGDTDVSLGGAYTGWDSNDTNGSYIVGAYAKQKFGMFDATLAATYQNDGKADYSKYTDYTNPVGGDKSWAVGVDLGAELAGGRLGLYGSYSGNDNNDSKTVAGVKYGKTVKGIALSVGYQYTKCNDFNPHHRVRAKAVYKF